MRRKRIGDLAVSLGLATPKQVDEAVATSNGAPIGRALVSQGTLTESDLENLLLDQARQGRGRGRGVAFLKLASDAADRQTRRHCEHKAALELILLRLSGGRSRG